ncbi:MAG: TraB/GumN family protein [Rhizomicrobium sp.]|nr:TraB/GumN family protein [Rhizomicrobium sp.]
MKSGIVALSTFLLSSAALAQEQPATGWTSNEVVVVTAQQPGPAFWHIKKGDSEIYILGIIQDMLKAQSWNSKHLAEVIDGAHAVLTPPTASSGIFGAGWFLLTHRSLLSMPDDKKLEETLPTDLRARFVAARNSLAISPATLDDDPPIWVAFQLQNKFTATAKLDEREPMATVKKIADTKNVSLHPIADYPALDLIKEALRLPLAAQQICLDESLTKLELRKVHAAALAEAWAVGDLKAVKAHYVERGFNKCFKQVPSFSHLTDQAAEDYLKAIDAALAKPGKTVLVADIGDLLRGTGVAEQLHAKGITVEGPPE